MDQTLLPLVSSTITPTKISTATSTITSTAASTATSTTIPASTSSTTKISTTTIFSTTSSITTSTLNRTTSTILTSLATNITTTIPLSSSSTIRKTTKFINPPDFYQNYSIDFITVLIGLLLFFALILIGFIILKKINKGSRSRSNYPPVQFVNNPFNNTATVTNAVGGSEYGYDNNNNFRELPSVPNRMALMNSISEGDNDLIMDSTLSNHASVTSTMSTVRPRNLFNENLSFDKYSSGSNLPDSLNETRSETAQPSNSEILVDVFSDDKTNQKTETNKNPFF